MWRIALSCYIVLALSACDSNEQGAEEISPLAVALPGSPNFAIIVLDDWGYADYGAATPGIVTPNIDTIASTGFVFHNAFLTTSSCSSSRASILMGRYPTATGAPHLHDNVPPGRVSLPEALAQGGYHTEAVGKWHLGGAFKQRFGKLRLDRTFGSESQWVTALQERPRDKPFFFWLSSFDPHLPHDAPEKFRVHDPDTLPLPDYLADMPATRAAYAGYLDEIHRVDYYIGEVIDELHAQGVMENTWIVVMADNGPPLPAAKTTLYDHGIKTPLLILGPAGTGEYAGLISSVDLAPTFIELAGLGAPDTLQGKSFKRAFERPDYQHRDVVFAEQNNHGFRKNQVAVRAADLLLIKTYYAQVACLLEMPAIWQDLKALHKANRANTHQSVCRRKPREGSLELYAIEQGENNFANLALTPRYADRYIALSTALESWEETYRSSVCNRLQCAEQ